jgi:hypothetical protein
MPLSLLRIADLSAKPATPEVLPVNEQVLVSQPVFAVEFLQGIVDTERQPVFVAFAAVTASIRRTDATKTTRRQQYRKYNDRQITEQSTVPP